MLKLPAYTALSREQVAVNELPTSGHHLVIGPPGSGKTVMALYRTSMFAKAGRRTQLIVHGRPLRGYLEQAIKQEGLDGVAKTFYSWFWGWYREVAGTEPPTLNGEKWKVDWAAALKRFSRPIDPRHRIANLIIDEGQDFSPDFYLVMRLIADSVTIFADENQRLTDTSSSLQDIRASLGPERTLTLRKNYRNSRPISQFAQQFYSQSESGMTELPTRAGPKPKLLHGRSLARQADFIATYEANHADSDIGVLVKYTRSQDVLFNLLKGRTKSPVQLYSHRTSGEKNSELRFDKRGIKIITYQSAKGLEFDTVFLPLLDEVDRTLNVDDQMRWYVTSSRARDELHLMTSGSRDLVALRGLNEALLDT